ncbi:DNA mismatch repair protein MutS [bacterium]|nr:DNA mismatch repair protein MutS [bacterium]
MLLSIAMKNFEINNINSIDVNPDETTPMMRQYLEIKKQNPEILLLYRMGDFYECFFEDALVISKDLELTLTHKEAGSIGHVNMAGLPAKALDNYVQKLIEKGHKVAICEQMEDPATAKGLVKREVVRTITPGTVTESNILKANENNFLAALYKVNDDNIYALSYTDITTGEFKACKGELNMIISELARISPSEIIAPPKAQKILPFQIVPEEVIDLPEEITNFYICSKVNKEFFNETLSKNVLLKLFGVQSLESFCKDTKHQGLVCAGAIARYIFETQKDMSPKYDKIEIYELSDYVLIDYSTRKNLELNETMRDKNKYGSLLWVLDSTKTNMGARLLKKWISQPLKCKEQIEKRLDAVEEFVAKPRLRAELNDILSRIYDIQRTSMRLSNGTVNPRDFLALKETLSLLPELAQVLSQTENNYFNSELLKDEGLQSFCNIIDRTIDENAPPQIKEGGLIKRGVDAELDYFKDLLTNGEQWLESFKEKEIKRTKIDNLKVAYNKVFGFYIEVTKSNLDLVPENYIRRQTLVGAERYITEDLKKHEDEVLSAQSKTIQMEYKIFCNLREYAKEFAAKVSEVAELIAKIDVLLSFATVSNENNYTRPQIINEPSLDIINGRHPVVEKILPLGTYVANDLHLMANSITTPQFMILTGPNMAGKSTYMRQNALIVIMAQIGCFVSADAAKIGIADKIFTRVGAVDDLSLGQSTFMVEMVETANILNNATQNSLILLDEIGRGTSTYDGVAIAWSVSEYIASKIKARTIFATHYHELNVMPASIPQTKNYRITITEKDGEIEFLRKVVEGAASKSYGIQVAKMAGLPKEVIEESEKLLIKMQKDLNKDLSKKKKSTAVPEVPQLSLTFKE